MTAYIVAYSVIIFLIAVATVVISILWVRTQNTKLNERLAISDVLRDGERAFVDIFGTESNIAFLLIDSASHKPIYISPNVHEFFGIPTEKLFLNLSDMEHVVGKKAWRAFKRDYFAWTGDGLFSFEFKCVNDRRAVAQAVRAVRGEKMFDAFVVYDITERDAERKELREALDDALEQAAGKLSFLSSMSHEIRTPMNGVMGMMELARMNINNPEKAMEYLTRAGDLSVFLLGMINDILDISKIESGKMQLFNTPFDIYAFADKIKNMFNGMVTGKGIEFNVETSVEARYLIADEMRLTQVVTNFISNANKFTPSGGRIDVTFKQLDHIGGKIQLLIRVRDTGKGIAPENIRKIMRPFEQEEASTAHHYGGTGLGLAICDQIVQLMGGNIVVDSVLGKGTDFSVFLSLEVAKDSSEIVPETVSNVATESGEKFTFDGCRILLAEDNEVNAEIAIEILESEGAIVTHARDGQEAVDIFKDKPDHSFDLILLDIQMPKLNGREVARAIRSSGRTDADALPIIALSADAFAEDVALSKQAGMDGHVAKPIDFDALRVTAGTVIAEKAALKV